MNLNPAMWTVHAWYRKSGVCSHTTISDKLGNGGSLNLVVVILSQTPCILCILTVEMLIGSIMYYPRLGLDWKIFLAGSNRPYFQVSKMSCAKFQLLLAQIGDGNMDNKHSTVREFSGEIPKSQLSATSLTWGERHPGRHYRSQTTTKS